MNDFTLFYLYCWSISDIEFNQYKDSKLLNNLYYIQHYKMVTILYL